MIDISPLVMKLIGALAIIIACVVGWITFAVHYENKGYAKAIAAIAAKDKGALDAVHDATGKVDECYTGGRTWNVTVGMCE